MNKEIIEAVKEGLRVVAIAVIPVVIVMIENGSMDYKTVSVVAVVALLRAVDKFLHETGKEAGDSSLIKGITRF